MKSALTFATLACLLLAGCSIPGPSADEDEIQWLDREDVRLETRAFAGPVSYLRAGEPRVARVVFVHGTPGDARGWADFLLDVPDGQEYVAIDRPGFGQSAPEGPVLSMDAQARALRPFLEAPGDAPVILVGHSLGAAVIARAARLYPDRVAGLVILAGALDPALEDPHWAQPLGTWPPFSWLLPRGLDNANRELLAYEKQLRALEPDLGAIDQPVRIVHGVQDELVPFANVAFMKSELTAAPMHVTRLENAGHFLPWEAFSIVQAAINTLVARVCGGLTVCER
jgi:pimeloyl-ACP methyl ester carboxylesterase